MRIADGSIGWAPGAAPEAIVPAAPTLPMPKKKAPRGKTAGAVTAMLAGAPATPGAHSVLCATETEPAAFLEDAAAEAAAPTSDEWALTSNSLPPASAIGAGPAAARLGAPARTLVGVMDSAGRLNASPSYLRKVMGELHSNERVPLWKEEMVERVKRQATSRQQRDSLAFSAPPPTRSAGSTHSLRFKQGHDDTMSAASSRKVLSVADSFAESGLPPTRNQAKEIERKLFWYQDAIHEQELQQQLLEQKIRALADELTQVRLGGQGR